ncbi:MAG: spondin domain-containing protein [Gammaproteobacteria bacterium]
MFVFALAFIALLFSNAAFAEPTFQYEVSVTNITKGQTFTPTLVAAADGSVSIFELGSAASPALEILAEAGDTSPLTQELLGLGRHVSGVQTIPGLLGPGQTTKVTLSAAPLHRRLILAAMLIPTNDNFYALNAVELPLFGTATYLAPAYDAGTEENDQNCANIPGPRCGGEGHSAGPNPGDEGFVFIGEGFHELGTELEPAQYDWRNPVARITVRRMR